MKILKVIPLAEVNGVKFGMKRWDFATSFIIKMTNVKQ